MLASNSAKDVSHSLIVPATRIAIITPKAAATRLMDVSMKLAFLPAPPMESPTLVTLVEDVSASVPTSFSESPAFCNGALSAVTLAAAERNDLSIDVPKSVAWSRRPSRVFRASGDLIFFRDLSSPAAMSLTNFFVSAFMPRIDAAMSFCFLTVRVTNELKALSAAFSPFTSSVASRPRGSTTGSTSGTFHLQAIDCREYAHLLKKQL